MVDNLMHYVVVNAFVDLNVRSYCIYLVYNAGLVSSDRGKKPVCDPGFSKRQR